MAIWNLKRFVKNVVRGAHGITDVGAALGIPVIAEIERVSKVGDVVENVIPDDIEVDVGDASVSKIGGRATGIVGNIFQLGTEELGEDFEEKVDDLVDTVIPIKGVFGNIFPSLF